MERLLYARPHAAARSAIYRSPTYRYHDLDHRTSRGGLLRERDEAVGSEGPAREGLVKMGQLRGERVGLRAYDEARAEPRLQRAGLGLGLGLG